MALLLLLLVWRINETEVPFVRAPNISIRIHVEEDIRDFCGLKLYGYIRGDAGGIGVSVDAGCFSWPSLLSVRAVVAAVVAVGGHRRNRIRSRDLGCLCLAPHNIPTMAACIATLFAVKKVCYALQHAQISTLRLWRPHIAYGPDIQEENVHLSAGVAVVHIQKQN